MSKITRIDLLRHGETTAGVCFLGATDAPLNAVGWQQMQTAIMRESYQQFISSPLKRCADFAQKTSQENKIQLTIENELQEINFGDWEAKTTEQIWQTESTQLKLFWQDPIKNTPPKGECYAEFQERVNWAFKKIANTYQGKHILLITHGGVIRQILSEILTLDFKQAQKIRIDYAGLSRVEYYDESVSLAFINQRVIKPDGK